MGENTEERSIISAFPKLAEDCYFKITSKKTPTYNCIAWAYGIDNRWMWPNTGKYHFIDGVHFWPDDNIIDENVDNFIEAFVSKGYEICENCAFDAGYRKIALYVKPNTKTCTHAARELRNGYWTSKLGDKNDIQHESPFSIEGDWYGVVHCIMRMRFE